MRLTSSGPIGEFCNNRSIDISPSSHVGDKGALYHRNSAAGGRGRRIPNAPTSARRITNSGRTFRHVRKVPNRRHRACTPLAHFLSEDLAFTRKGQSEHNFSCWRALRPPLDAVLAYVAD